MHTHNPNATEQAPEAVFTVQRMVRFSDCDPAGIVFYPQYFVMLNGLVEDWFNQALQVDYATLLGQRQVGLPTVSLQSEFKAPSRMGETIALELRVLRQGSRSITLGVRCLGAHAPHTLRWSAQLVLVTTALVLGSSIAIPPDIVQAIGRWQQLSGGNP